MYPPRLALISLLLSAFMMAVGYGVLLPVLPALVARLAAGASQGVVVWHTGLVTAIYAGSALIMAPIMGRVADRTSAPPLIVLALTLTGLATLAASYATDLLSLYALRFVAGIGSGAIGPVTQAWLGRWAPDDDVWRTRRVVWIGLASTAGLFIGPFVGGLSATLGTRFGTSAILGQQLPLITAGFLLLVTAVFVALTVRRAPPHVQSIVPVANLLRRIAILLVPVAITALAIGAFEVVLAFMSNGQRMSPFEIGLLFAQCTLLMFAAQAFLIMPRFRDRPLKHMIVPALVILSAGLGTMTFASGLAWHIISTGLVAIGGGLLPPILAREISALDGGSTGTANGIQSAASQAGQTAGAVFASVIAATIEPRWTFIAAAMAVLAAGAFLLRVERRDNLQRTAS